MKLLARTLSIAAFFGGVAVLHADTAAPAPVVLSPADMSVKAEAIRAQILEDNQKILGLEEQARKLKDVIKLTCVNDKQVQVKAEMNIADLANDQLQGALQRNKPDEQQAAFGKLAGVGEEVRKIREAAAACIGESEMFKQEQGGSVEAPAIVDDPTTNNPFGGGEVEPPASASK